LVLYLHSADFFFAKKETGEIFSVVRSAPLKHKGVVSQNRYKIIFEDSSKRISKPIIFLRQAGGTIPSVKSKVRVDTRLGVTKRRYIERACVMKPPSSSEGEECQELMLEPFL